MQGTQNLESQQTDITSVFKRTTDYQGEPQNHTVADCFYYDFFFFFYITLLRFLLILYLVFHVLEEH